jgi:uncharacterized protein
VRKALILLSPVLVVILGTAAARFFYRQHGDWAWVGTFTVYWISLALMTALLGDRARIEGWFRKPQGSRWWALLAILAGLAAFPMLLLPNLEVMKPTGLVILWLLFAVVNGTLEEVYWRGFLLDETRHLPRAFGLFYSTVLFTAIHPLMLGHFSHIQSFDPANPMAFLPFGIILVVLSLILCLLYLKTRSLWWSILTHFLSDLGNLSIFVFMNLVAM